LKANFVSSDIIKALLKASLSVEAQKAVKANFNMPKLESGDFFIGYALSACDERIAKVCLSKSDLKLLCVCGDYEARSFFVYNLLKVIHEANEKFIVLDTYGAYVGLIREIPELKVFKLGEDFSLNIFQPIGVKEDYALILVEVLKSVLNLDDVQARYLLKALKRVYEEGIEKPTAEDLLDSLLAVEAEVSAREVFKLESLKMVLESLQVGFAGLAFNAESTISLNDIIKPPVILDLKRVYSVRLRTLAQAVLTVKLAFGNPLGSLLVLEDAQYLLPSIQRAMRQDLVLVYERIPVILHLFDAFSSKNLGVVLSCSSPSEISREALSRSKTKVFCRGLSENDVSLIARMFSLSSEQLKTYISLGTHRYLISKPIEHMPMLIELEGRPPTEVSDGEIVAHMEKLGFSREKLKVVTYRRSLLERLFKDLKDVAKAYKLLDFIKSNRIPHGSYRAIPFLTEQEFRQLIKVFLRHKLITDYYDRDGVRWYAITSFGEDVLTEFEDNVRKSSSLSKEVEGGEKSGEG